MLDEYLPLALIPLCTLAYYAYSKSQKPDLPLPPSPKSDPLIGHLRSLPSVDEYRVYRDMGIELKSDIISLTVMGQTIVVLNSAGAAEELLDKRSLIYSDRPEFPMLNDERLVGWGKNTGFMRYGEQWKKQRKVTQGVLHASIIQDFYPMMVRKSRFSLARLIDNPDSFGPELRWMVGAIILHSVYGYEASPSNDSFVDLVETSVKHLCEAALPGNFYVNTIPWLVHVPAWFPGAGWKHTAKLWREEGAEVINRPFNFTKSQMAAGTAPPSMLKKMLTDLDTNGPIQPTVEEEEEMFRWVTSTLFTAGADTSVSGLITFILAMVLYPEVQARARAEIDSVLKGEDRLPELSDKDSMPYMNCIIKEVLRWQSIVPMGVIHACSQDDVYKGYRIPKGAIVIGNIWAISHDPSTYPDPETFNPDRFLDPSLPEAPAFGFGRRICPGNQYAESILFITMCTMLCVFDLKPARDENGREILPEPKMGPNLMVSHPIPFKCSITPRSEKHRLLLQDWVEV